MPWPLTPPPCHPPQAEFLGAIATTKEHITAGDIFQLVLSQRFERRTFADPFEIYRALRVVNPSPYMVYMQTRGCILVSSSPEILARCDDWASRLTGERGAGISWPGATTVPGRQGEEEAGRAWTVHVKACFFKLIQP